MWLLSQKAKGPRFQKRKEKFISCWRLSLIHKIQLFLETKSPKETKTERERVNGFIYKINSSEKILDDLENEFSVQSFLFFCVFKKTRTSLDSTHWNPKWIKVDQKLLFKVFQWRNELEKINGEKHETAFTSLAVTLC